MFRLLSLQAEWSDMKATHEVTYVIKKVVIEQSRFFLIILRLQIFFLFFLSWNLSFLLAK